MRDSDRHQSESTGIPQASYPVRVYCRRCGHLAELKVGMAGKADLGG